EQQAKKSRQEPAALVLTVRRKARAHPDAEKQEAEAGGAKKRKRNEAAEDGAEEQREEDAEMFDEEEPSRVSRAGSDSEEEEVTGEERRSWFSTLSWSAKKPVANALALSKAAQPGPTTTSTTSTHKVVTFQEPTNMTEEVTKALATLMRSEMRLGLLERLRHSAPVRTLLEEVQTSVWTCRIEWSQFEQMWNLLVSTQAIIPMKYT
ncbi:unnamed protein product, partial [Amoebophrya sp. A25]